MNWKIKTICRENSFKNHFFGDLGDGSVVMSTGCFSRGPSVPGDTQASLQLLSWNFWDYHNMVLSSPSNILPPFLLSTSKYLQAKQDATFPLLKLGSLKVSLVYWKGTLSMGALPWNRRPSGVWLTDESWKSAPSDHRRALYRQSHTRWLLCSKKLAKTDLLRALSSRESAEKFWQ